MKSHLFFVILLSLNLVCKLYAQDQVIPLPSSIASIDDIVNEFRDTTTDKIDELSKNFISLINDKTVIFTASNELRCNGLKTPVGQAVSSLQYVVKKNPNELIEKTVYTGCNGTISLIEDVISRGSDLSPLDFNNFIKGKRVIDLRPNENYRYYRLSNSDNEEIFKLIIERRPNGKVAQFFLVESNFLTLNYEFSETETKLQMMYNGYKGKYVRQFASWEFDRLYEPFKNTVVAKKSGKFIETTFYDTRGVQFTQKDFLTRVNEFLFNGPLKRIRDFLDYHNYYFPSTEVVKASGQNEVLKEELRLAFNRLQNNSELNLVKKLIQEYIEAVNLGQILDKRPKK